MSGKRPPPLLVALAAVLACAWVRPTLPTTAKPGVAYGERLDYVIVAVNGEPHLVHDGEELAVVRGDALVVREAALHDAAAAPRTVSVVGAPHGLHGDDRGRPFTTQQLRVKASEGRKGETFAILVQTRRLLHGAVYLHVIEPELRYAEVSINGETRVLRDGEPLSVRASDQLKVEKVATNLRSTDGVLFRIDKATAGGEKGEYEIRFTRAGQPFATIPLKVSD